MQSNSRRNLQKVTTIMIHINTEWSHIQQRKLNFLFNINKSYDMGLTAWGNEMMFF